MTKKKHLRCQMKFLLLIKGKFNKVEHPTDIYDEPINRFVADFIGESNIVIGKMIRGLPC